MLQFLKYGHIAAPINAEAEIGWQDSQALQTTIWTRLDEHRSKPFVANLQSNFKYASLRT